MPSFKVAHLKEQGVDLIIVPVTSNFGDQAFSDQERFVSDFQGHAHRAGLAGAVVPVWTDYGGRTHFIAPPNWHPFFEGLSFDEVLQNINKEIRW